jgi:FkbM family methyltransferase
MSQAGQDYWVYGEVFNETEDGFFLDIGAHDGVFLSNTFILEKIYNWEGICIEANPKTFVDLEASRDCKCINKCIDKQSGSVSFTLDGIMGGIVASDVDNTDASKKEIVNIDTISLQQLLCQEKAPSVIDYLSIDIEGAEDRALLEFDFDTYQFNCITIERPSGKLRGLLVSKGYLLIKEIPKLDCFYIHKSFKKYQKNLFSFGRKKFLTRRWR